MTGDASAGMTFLGWDDSNALYYVGENAIASGRRPIQFTTDDTNVKFGRDAEVIGGEVVFTRGHFVGPTLSGSRNVSNNTSLRTTGDKAKGDVERNRNPSPGAPAGWLCTTGHATAPTFTGHYGVGTQQSNIADADVAHDINATFSDTEVEAALDALGTKINSLIAAMEHFGFTET